MKRSGFKSKAPAREPRDPDRIRSTPSAPAAWIEAAPVDPQAFAALPKPEALRHPFLLTMANREACLLRVPGVCNRDPLTTVACHSNWSEHGKGGGRKADDCWHVWGCSACHEWLDRSGAPQEEKRARFDDAHRWMREIWTEIAYEMQPATPRQREAARWALDSCKKSLARGSR